MSEKASERQYIEVGDAFMVWDLKEGRGRLGLVTDFPFTPVSGNCVVIAVTGTRSMIGTFPRFVAVRNPEDGCKIGEWLDSVEPFEKGRFRCEYMGAYPTKPINRTLSAEVVAAWERRASEKQTDKPEGAAIEAAEAKAAYMEKRAKEIEKKSLHVHFEPSGVDGPMDSAAPIKSYLDSLKRSSATTKVLSQAELIRSAIDNLEAAEDGIGAVVHEVDISAEYANAKLLALKDAMDAFSVAKFGKPVTGKSLETVDYLRHVILKLDSVVKMVEDLKLKCG